MIQFIPSLMFLPTWFAPFKREARDYLAPLMQRQSDRYEKRFSDSLESFSRRYLEFKTDWGATDREIVWVLSTIYGGASGTSATAMQSMILNTCLFPEWQQRVQKEIEDEVGDQRLPDFDDFSSLPTVRAVIKESMRCRPVLSGGLC
jgi:cytochrome P450